MLASYTISRTLTPVIIGILLKGERHGEGSEGWFARFHAGFDRGFERFRRGYVRVLAILFKRWFIVPVIAALMLTLGGVMLTVVGRDFFPAIDGGQIKLHVRAPAETRIEATEGVFQDVEDKIREIIPARDRDLIVDDFGVPQRPYNLAFTDGSTINVNDGVILISLKDGHAPTADYVRRLRETLPAAFPSAIFYFQAADMTTQILNFGLPAQIDVRVVGPDRATNVPVAKELRRRIAAIPGIADAHVQQELDAPAFMVNIDRSRALELGLNAETIANDVNTSLSSSEQVYPNFLDRSGKWDSLLLHGPDARASRELAHPAGQYAGVHPDRLQWPDTSARAPQQRGEDSPRKRSDQSEPEQHPAGLRHLRQRARS